MVAYFRALVKKKLNYINSFPITLLHYISQIKIVLSSILKNEENNMAKNNYQGFEIGLQVNNSLTYVLVVHIAVT